MSDEKEALRRALKVIEEKNTHIAALESELAAAKQECEGLRETIQQRDNLLEMASFNLKCNRPQDCGREVNGEYSGAICDSCCTGSLIQQVLAGEDVGPIPKPEEPKPLVNLPPLAASDATEGGV